MLYLHDTLNMEHEALILNSWVGLMGEENEYGYQEATGVLSVKAMHSEGKQKKIINESSVKIGGHLRKANEETILKVSI